MPEELWMEVHNIVQEAVIKTIPKKKKCKKAEWLSEEALQIAKEKREAKAKGEKERYAQKIARRDKKTFLVITANKASGYDGIPTELFQILEDNAVKVLHSIC